MSDFVQRHQFPQPPAGIRGVDGDDLIPVLVVRKAVPPAFPYGDPPPVPQGLDDLGVAGDAIQVDLDIGQRSEPVLGLQLQRHPTQGDRGLHPVVVDGAQHLFGGIDLGLLVVADGSAHAISLRAPGRLVDPLRRALFPA